MQFLVVLSLCAVLALWMRISIPSVDTSIKVDGVYLGMTRAELENRPDIEEHRWTEVSYDADDRVARVFGTTVEIRNVDLTPDFDDEVSFRGIEAALGKPDLVSPEEFSFSYSSRYHKESLTIEVGCSGYSFLLGSDERISGFVPYEEKARGARS